MALVVVLHPLLRRLYSRVAPVNAPQPMPLQRTSETDGNVYSHQSLDLVSLRSEERLVYDFYFALLFIVALHGVSAFKIIGILYVNFCIATKLPREHITTVTWLFNIGILFANELCNGYTVKGIAENFLSFSPQAIALGDQIDRFGGIIPRWQILYKVTILRQISFNLDHLWSLDQRTSSPIEVSVHSHDCAY